MLRVAIRGVEMTTWSFQRMAWNESRCLPELQNTVWFCRATWRHVPSLCMKIPLGDISKWGWPRLQPWTSHGATTEITKLWSATCLGFIIPPLQCSKGKTLTIPRMRVKKAGNTPEFPWAHLELMSTLKIYDSGVYLVRKMEIGSHLRTYLLTQNALWHAAKKQTCPPTKPSIVLMKNEKILSLELPL